VISRGVVPETLLVPQWRRILSSVDSFGGLSLHARGKLFQESQAIVTKLLLVFVE
jgi:hypothetical protein